MPDPTNKLDEHRQTSEQDYGPWLDAATLYDTSVDGGEFLLKVESGYSKPYEVEWYKLGARPGKPLSDLIHGELWGGAVPEETAALLSDMLEVPVQPLPSETTPV